MKCSLRALRDAVLPVGGHGYYHWGPLIISWDYDALRYEIQWNKTGVPYGRKPILFTLKPNRLTRRILGEYL